MIDGKTSCSCLVLAPEIDGREVTTVEGLADHGHLTPVQDAFIDNSGLQCGFCTPGVILSSYDLLQHNSKPNEEEIRHALEGNYCRCTGYHNIVKAIH